jgi:serine/threonine-protein kinase HipA
MLYGKDGSLSYFIKRFDRYGKGSKFNRRFCSIDREYKRQKYRFTMEKLIPVLDEYCSFPQLKKLIFLKEFFFVMLLEMRICI